MKTRSSGGGEWGGSGGKEKEEEEDRVAFPEAAQTSFLTVLPEALGVHAQHYAPPLSDLSSEKASRAPPSTIWALSPSNSHIFVCGIIL